MNMEDEEHTTPKYYLSPEGVRDTGGELIIDCDEMRRAIDWIDHWRGFNEGKITLPPDNPFTGLRH